MRSVWHFIPLELTLFPAPWSIQVDEEGIPSDNLTGESLYTCKEIGSTATTVEEAKNDPKVRGGLELECLTVVSAFPSRRVERVR